LEARLRGARRWAARRVWRSCEGGEVPQRCSLVAGRTRPTGVAGAVGIWGGSSLLVTGGGWLPRHLAADISCKECSAGCADTILVEYTVVP